MFRYVPYKSLIMSVDMVCLNFNLCGNQSHIALLSPSLFGSREFIPTQHGVHADLHGNN